MAARRPPPPLPDALIEAYATSNRMNRYLIENLPEKAWRADPPDGKGRTIAAIAAHIHNVRHMWLTASAPAGLRIPPKLDRLKVTRRQALDALAKSEVAMTALVEPAVRGDGRIRNFPRGVVAFLAYVMAHEAHHRGQMTMLARQCGHGLAMKAMFGMWEWGKV